MGLMDMDAMPRRTMVLFFILDTSGSMSGGKIDTANDTIRDVLPIIGDISTSNPDAEIKIAALKFDDNAEWITQQPMLASDFSWSDAVVGGWTNLGLACSELNRKLSKNEFLKSDGGYYAPAFILLSDGEPTDDYMLGLSELKNNKWFKYGIKTAVAIGNDANQDVLKEFTGNKEAVFTVHNKKALEKIIRLIAVSSSTIGSQSTASDESKQAQVVEDINKQLEEDNTGVGTSNKPSKDNYDDWD